MRQSRNTMRTYENAGRALQQLLDARGLKPAALAEATGIDAGVLRRILSGRQKSISTRNLLAFSRYFGLSLIELIDLLS